MVERVLRLIGVSVKALLRQNMTSKVYPRERENPESSGCDMSSNGHIEM